MVDCLKQASDPNLLIGMDTMDDAGVYKITDDIALVQTVDIITPVIDDPTLYGQIAAANSLSDVYAKGGRPINAMNVCCFPPRGLDVNILNEILTGALSKINEAGAVLVGGHTVKDEELKFGLSVTGLVHPKKVIRNSTAKPGDRMILTKPIGSGVIVSGTKRGVFGSSQEPLMNVAKFMATLNKVAAEVMLNFQVNACTDITGFGLVGHSRNIAIASKIGMRFWFDSIPRFPESLDLIKMGVATGTTMPNRELSSDVIEFPDSLKPEEEWLVFDPQTSGGLLISVADKDANKLLGALKEKGIPASLVGEVFASDKPRIQIVRK